MFTQRKMMLPFVAALLSAGIAGCMADGGSQAWSYAAVASWGGSCQNGTLQSPLNVRANMTVLQQQRPSPVTLNYSSSAILRSERTATGTQQFAIPVGNNITINGTQYKALSMHWHTPSEHAINGRHGPAELHIIHIDSNQNPAVIGVLYTRGPADPLLQAFLEEEPPFTPFGQNSTGPSVGPLNLKAAVSSYIPNGTTGSFVTYMGSLTTPPCTEGVQWLLSTLNATMTDAQIVALQAANGANETFGTNARPVQAGSPSQLITPL